MKFPRPTRIGKLTAYGKKNIRFREDTGLTNLSLWSSLGIQALVKLKNPWFGQA